MSDKTKKKQKFIDKIRNKYRLVVMNDETFEEKLSFRLSRLNVFVVVGTMSILLIIITTYIIAFTPLREYIPGYADFDTRKILRQLIYKADSLQTNLNQKDLYIQNLKDIMEGKDPSEKVDEKIDKDKNKKYNDIKLQKSKEDSVLRAEFENEYKFNLVSSEGAKQAGSINNFFFFVPVKGIITNHFNATKKHYGIDIVAKRNEIIKSTLDGTVIFSSWTSETGYVIAIQHANNLISIYKHNSVLLKKTGDYVKAGEAISIIGETGELSTGLHLHFEIWFNGRPVNPAEYMVF